MSQILNKVRDVDPNNSEAVKDALTTFFQNLSKHTDVDCNRWLRALENVINRFPKYCFSHRNTIETYLIHFLDSKSYYNVVEAAKSAHGLQQVRPSQEKSATAKSCWRDLMNVLCNSAHALIGIVFPNAVDIYQHSGKSQKDKQTTITALETALSRISSVAAKNQNNSRTNKQELLFTRLRNVFIFIQAMLVEIYPVAKPIRPQTILDVVVRALSVSSGTTNSSQDPSDVTMVKTQALRTLDALVACLGSNLIPFSPLIFRMVIQTLKWSSEHPSAESSKVRCAAYSSLCKWLTKLRSHRADAARGRAWEDELATHVLADVTPARHLVQLTVNAQPTKHLSKKAKRKLTNTMLQESNISSHMPGEKNKLSASEVVNDEVALAALECAEIFLTVCGMFLKPTTHKSFQERLVRECYNLDAYSRERAAALLRALDACRRGAPPGVPPPTQYCLHLYSVMVNHDHGEISSFCSRALLDIRLHLHCSPPSLNYALEPQAEKQNKKEDKKKISEKNRAALEALLGAEKLPTQVIVEEVITISDEPSSKRPRLEEVISDKISVSSESVESVEISDGSDEEDSAIQEVEVVIENEKEKKKSDEENNAGKDALELDITDGTAATQPKTIDNDVKRLDNKTENKTDKKYFVQEKTTNIYDACTQMPLNTSNETLDEDESPISMEVAYDYPNTGQEKVTVLEKMDDENLPSTNETDDIQITCGQVVKYSQDVDTEKKLEDLEVKTDAEVPMVNGVKKSPEKVLENGISETVGDKDGKMTTKVGTNDNGVTVEDMLADFVDEVNEDSMQA